MTTNEKAEIILAFLVAGVIFLTIVGAAIVQNDEKTKTCVTVKDTTNSVYISVDASRTFTGYRWEDDGKTLIITYEEADHATD